MVHNSRVLLLVDTSLSMGLSDAEAGIAAAAPRAASGRWPPPWPRAIFSPRLRKTHDVAVYQFNNSLDRDRVVSLGKLPPQAPPPNGASRAAIGRAADLGRPTDATGGSSSSRPARKPAWARPLQQLIHQERGPPLAGVVLLSDGGQNAGAGPEAAVELAREAKIPVFTVGLGSDKKPPSVRVNDLAAPVRAYPGDRYTVTGYVQAQGLAGRVVTVQLLSRDVDRGGRPLAARHGPGRGQPAGHPRRRRRGHAGAASS